MTATLNKTTVDSKAVFARMMATENLAVEHDPKAETAYFDVESRKLVFPCWQGMTDHLYDMLAGHETAHALFTPSGAASLEAAVKAVDPRPEAASAAKTYLNVVEDARIERLVKEKYPGLRRTFFLAYQDLVKSELMAPAVGRIAELKLIDRANMHYKVGTFVNVPFSEAELNLVQRMEKTKTFEEVVELAREMWQFEQENQKKQKQEQKQAEKSEEKGSSTTSETQQGEESEEGEGSGEGQKSESAEKGEEKSNKKSESKGTGNEKTEEQSESETGKAEGDNTAASTGGEGSEAGAADEIPTESKTDGMLSEFSKSKRDASAKWFSTMDLPTFLPEIGVIPAKEVIPMLVQTGEMYNGLKHFTDWKNRNAESVAVLCREFERRRAAEAASRTSMSDSGCLDVNRLWSYRVSDDIFRQYANVKNGQSHGIQVFVDFSGSMSGILYETLCQMVALAAFCRRMNIPFDVYAFTDGLPSIWTHRVGSEKVTDEMTKEGCKYDCFKSTEKGLAAGDGIRFRLIQLLTTGMTERDFRMAVGGMLAIVTREVPYVNNFNIRNANQLFRLNGTPTNAATVAAMTLVPAFRKNHNLQIVHAVFLTDGESGDRLYAKGEARYGRYSDSPHGFIFRDAATGNTDKCSNPWSATEVNRSLNHLLAKRVQGCNVIGISLCPTREFRQVMINGNAKKGKDGSYDDAIETAKVKGYAEASDCYGYTKWFGMNAPYLDNSDYFVAVDSDAPKAVLTKAFAKTIKKSTLNRSLLTRFVDLISTHGKN